MSEAKSVLLCNPAVVGFVGLGLTIISLQLHNLELCGLGPFIAYGFVFDSIAQLNAVFSEQISGNNFGYSTFTAYGAFWISLSIILLFNKFDIYPLNKTNIDYFLVAWVLCTMILLIAALCNHGVMSSAFTLLFISFILLDLSHLGYPAISKVAYYELILSAINTWYMTAQQIFFGIFGREVLHVGRLSVEPRSTAL